MRAFFAVLVALNFCTAAFAGEEADKTPVPTRTSDIYARPFDALTGEPLGDKSVTITRDGRELKFASQANADKFAADPVASTTKLNDAIAAEQRPLYPLKTCVISGEEMGTMGEPVEVVVNNRLFRLCCSGCKDQLIKNPKPAFEKVNAAVITAQKPAYPLKQCLVMDKDKLDADSIDYVTGNRLYRFCCKDCLVDFEKDPQKYAGKLEAAKK